MSAVRNQHVLAFSVAWFTEEHQFFHSSNKRYCRSSFELPWFRAALSPDLSLFPHYCQLLMFVKVGQFSRRKPHAFHPPDSRVKW